MPVELNPLMSFLSQVEQQRRRRQQEAAQQPAIQPLPKWAEDLDPEQFSGATRDMLMKARAAMGQQPNVEAKGDLQLPTGGAPLPDQAPERPAPADPGVMTDPQRRPRPPQPPAQAQSVEPARKAPPQQNGSPQAPQGRSGPDWFVASPGDRVLQMRGGGDGSGAIMGGRGGGNRPPSNAVAASAQPEPTGWREGQSPAEVNKSARGLMGRVRDFMGGGQGEGGQDSGPGLGYAIGGLGALLQEAGGQQGAVNDFVTRYRQYHQQRTEQAQDLARFNSTVQSALNMGIDPDYVMTIAETGDMGALVDAIQDERTFMREEGQPGAPKLATFELRGPAGDVVRRTIDIGTKDGRQAAQRLMAQGATEVPKTATEVNIGQGDPVWGEPPKNMVWARDESGEIMVEPDSDRPGAFRPIAVPVAGGPVEREAQAAEEEAQQEQQAQSLAMRSYEQKFQMVDDAITDVLGDTSFWTAGPAGAALSNVPGTPAYDMGRTIDTIKANLGFEELKNMRDASPTGGALGQVTERELAFLQAAQGNLDQAQTPEQLRKVLSDIQTRRRQFREARARAYEQDYGRPMPSMGTEVPAPDDEQGWQDMGNGIRVRRKQ